MFDRIMSSRFIADLVDNTHYLLSQPAARRTVPVVVSAGFTIVELLIVVVIIGILAAIVIVAYNGITNSATQASIKSDLASAAKKIEVFKTLSLSQTYPATPAELDAADFKLSQGSYAINRNNLYYCRTNDGLHYSLGVVALGNGVEYYLKDGVVTQMGANNVNSVNNCTNAGSPAPLGSFAGYDFSTGTGWAAWTQ